MKRFYLRLLPVVVLLLLSACTREIDPAGPVPRDDDATNPYFISVDEALGNLDQLLSVIDNDDATRGPQQTRERHIREVRTLRSAAAQNATRGSSAPSEERLHIVNFENDEGFALLSADRRLSEEIYAVAEGGNIDFDLLQELMAQHGSSDGTRAVPIGDSARVIPPFYHGILDLLQTPKDSLTLNKDLKLDTLGIHAKAGTYYYSDDAYYSYGPWEEVADSRIHPMLRTQWNQRSPFNYYAIRNHGETGFYAGCGPVALGQFIAFMKRERGIDFPYVFYHDGKDCYPVEWDQIERTYTYGRNRLSRSTSSYLYDLTPKEWKAVSGLIYYLGEVLDAKYNGGSGTSTEVDNMKKVIRNLHFIDGHALIDYDINGVLLMVRDRKLPVIMHGRSSEGGHAWLLDGLIEQDRIVEELLRGKLTKWRQCRYLIHCNWGWGNAGDGYYSDTFFKVEEGRIEQEPDFDDKDRNDEIQYYSKLRLEIYSLK